MEFSYFVGGSKIVTPTTVYDFFDLVELYKSDYIKNLTAKLISCTDAGEKMILKNKQPFITPYGTFSYRENKSILTHNSSLVAFDFDKLEQEKAQELKRILASNKSCLLATISGSQKGVKAFFLINDNIPLSEHYNTLKHNANNLLTTIGANEFKEFLDLRQFVLSQPMFISYDANIHYNFDAKPLDFQLEAYAEPQRALLPNVNQNWSVGVTDDKLDSVNKYVQKATENLCNFYNSHTGARHDKIAKVKRIAGMIKAYNLPIEIEIYNALESSIVGMYGGYKGATIGNAHKSLRNAWNTAEPLDNHTINTILQSENKTAQIEYLVIKNITEKAYLITDVNYFLLFIPKSQIIKIEDKIFTVTEWFYKNRFNN